jgi:DNA-binding transcriptional LysR family regulator
VLRRLWRLLQHGVAEMFRAPEDVGMDGFEWSDLQLLLAVARNASFGAAARRLGVAAPTVGRRVDALERALGLRLIERQSSGARVTPEGARIVALAEQAEERLAELERTALTLREGRAPAVRVSATESVIAERLAPALPQLFARDPQLRVDLSSVAAIVSLARGEADLAIRMVRPTGNSLIARRLATIRLGLYASRGYLAGRRPEQLALSDERLLGFDDSYGLIPELQWMRDAGLEAAVALRCSSTRALALAAAGGVGIALLPAALAERAGLLEIPAPRPIPARTPWLVMHAQSRSWPALRTVAAWVVQAFAETSPGREPGSRAGSPRQRRAPAR